MAGASRHFSCIASSELLEQFGPGNQQSSYGVCLELAGFEPAVQSWLRHGDTGRRPGSDSFAPEFRQKTKRQPQAIALNRAYGFGEGLGKSLTTSAFGTAWYNT